LVELLGIEGDGLGENGSFPGGLGGGFRRATGDFEDEFCGE